MNNLKRYGGQQLIGHLDKKPGQAVNVGMKLSEHGSDTQNAAHTDAASTNSGTSADRASAMTLDQAEVDRFDALAATWWDPEGEFKPLHQLGPARLTFIRDELASHFASGDAAPGLGNTMRPLASLRVLDIGCGGGLIAEPLARMGADVTAIDPAAETIAAADQHGTAQGLTINYRACRAEDLVAEDAQFDAVLCLEVIEHVPDVGAFLAAIAPLVRPGGTMILSTINRTIKSYALAIIGAEYVLRWLPVGTHQWERFVTPDELSRHVSATGLTPRHSKGLVYNILTDRWSVGADTDVNYMLSAIA